MTATTATIDITNPVLRGMYPDPSWMWDEPGERVAPAEFLVRTGAGTADPRFRRYRELGACGERRRRGDGATAADPLRA